MNSSEEKEIFLQKLMVVVIFITTVSQLPIFDEAKVTRFVAIPSWIITALILLPYFKIKKRLIPLIGILFLIAMYTIFLDTFTNNSYLSISILYPFYLSMFIFYMGMTIGEKINESSIQDLLKSYFIATILITISIYINYFMQGIDLYSSIYAYDSKNSIAQIIFTGIIVLVIVIRPRKLIYKFFKVLIATFMILIILFLKSRATIIGIPLLIAVPIFFSKDQLKLKITLLITAIIFSIIILANEEIYNVLVYGILAGGRDVNSLESISSGRYQEWVNFPYLIRGSELLGVGKYKIESFPLSVLLQFGIPVGIIFVVIAVWPFFWGIRNLDKSKSTNIAFLIISASYIINGIFEQLAPFGPGVKNYMLWLLFGILISKQSLEKKIIKGQKS